MEIYLNSLIPWSVSFESSLQSDASYYKTLVQIIQTSAQGHFHPLLFTHEQMLHMLSEVNDHAARSVLPWERAYITPEYIFSVARTTVVTLSKGIVVHLSIPLADTSVYSAYRTHKFPVAREFGNGKPKMVRVSPKFEMVIVSKDLRTYAYPPRDLQLTCSRYNSSLLCEPDFPIFNKNSRPTCEVELLNSNVAALKFCNSEVVTDSHPFFQRLKSTGEWLFSTLSPMEVLLVCGNQPEPAFRINGTGLLSIDGKCLAHAGEATLLGITTRTLRHAYRLKPFPEADPLLHIRKTLNLATIEDHEQVSQYIENWAESQDYISLKQIEEQYGKIARQRLVNNTTRSYFTIGGSATLLIMLSTLILFKFGCKCCAPILKYKWKSPTNLPEQKKHSDELEEVTTMTNPKPPRRSFSMPPSERKTTKYNKTLAEQLATTPTQRVVIP